MRFAPLSLVIVATVCSAGTITDVFNQTQTNCNYSTSAPYANCDVIGTPSHYDIQKATVTAGANGLTSITLYTNLEGVTSNNGTLTLGGFSDAGVNLLPADVFFYAPVNNNAVSNFLDPAVLDFANPQQNIEPYLTYGIALVNHNGLTAGDLYQITQSPSPAIQTAAQALNYYSNAYYRANLPVLMTGGTDKAAGNGVTVIANGNGTSAAEYAISLSFTAPTGSAFQSWLNSGQVGMLWSSTDCGNDYIQGVIETGSPVPEPSSFLLLLSGGMLVAGSFFSRRGRALLKR